MFTDIVGYTTLMAESEEMRVRERHRRLAKPRVERYGGEWIDEWGDASLSSFPSAVNAVNCALAIQRKLKGDGLVATIPVELPCLAHLSSEALREISSVTLKHYHEGATSFWEGTRDHDVSQNIAALCRHLPDPGPHTILDFGCGPGRDLITFRDLGHEAVGLEGAERFVQMARDHSGCEVLHQDFLALDLRGERFDGIFANAALFHVPSQELPRVLRELRASLKRDGVLFSSNPRGAPREEWSGDRYCCYVELADWRQFMTATGFIELEHYYRPTGKPRHLQPWLASVWRKS